MAGGDDPKEFPDVSQKLSAPKKLSQFEKDRQAAEEKKRREQAETAAALKEFEDSFAHDNSRSDDFDGFPSFQSAPTGPRGGGLGFGGPPGRFGAPPRSGPGSLGPPPPNLKRKRALDEMREAQEARRDQEDFYLSRKEGRGASTPNDRDDDEPVDVAPRPTVQLSSLPPASSEEDVRTLLRGHLQVHSVELQSPHGPGSTGRKSRTAIAQLSSETSGPEIDAAVSALKDRYLGCGYKLSISRHLSSIALQPGMPAVAASTSAEPLGAEKVRLDQAGGFNMRNAPPPSAFGPPDSYEAPAQPISPAGVFIDVQPPAEINTVRAIHTLADRLLSEPDPDRALQIEALLMADPEIQHDEHFSFLYDSRSPAGLYYRYLLWHDDGFEAMQAQKGFVKGPERILADVVVDWMPPSGEVPFADLSALGEILDHPSYPSDDDSEEDEADDQIHYNNGGREGEKPATSSEIKHLTPLQVAKFSWMLSSMPTAHTRLRKGQVAAVTSFAIRNARVGAEEIVNILIRNIEKPYQTTLCSKFDTDDVSQDEEDVYEPDEELPTIDSTTAQDGKVDKGEADDPAQIKLVTLYLINDILHSCATAGATNAWKYRQLFENAFKQRKIFQYLGRLEKELGWGRMRSDNWKRKINALFDIWGQGNVFALDVFDALKKDFFEQPSADNVESEEATEGTERVEEKFKGRFKRIDGIAASPAGSASPAPAALIGNENVTAPTPEVEGASLKENLDGEPLDDLDGEPMDDLDGEPMEDLDGEPMEDLDGEPMDDAPMTDAPKEAVASQPSTTESKPTGFSIKGSSSSQPPSKPAPARRKLAEDMFADSDEE